MNPVYIRLALYFIAPVVASMGVGTYDAVAHTVTISLDAAATALAGSALFTGAVFAKWGKR